MSMPSRQATGEVHYRDSDGKPIGETGFHVNTTYEIFGILKHIIFRDHPNVYVAAGMFLYEEEGNLRAVKTPDVMIIKGVDGTYERRSFKLWVEKMVPCVIFEVTSKKTQRVDTVVKPELYARLGVAEFFLFDPLVEYLDPPLIGYQLVGDRYSPIIPTADGRFESVHLGLGLRSEGTFVRFFDLETCEPIYSYFERLEKNENRKKAIEAQQGERLDIQKQINKHRRRAAREVKRAEAERQNAAADRQKAEELEAEIKRLRALLAEGGQEDVG